jgi:hypothetical protein
MNHATKIQLSHSKQCKYWVAIAVLEQHSNKEYKRAKFHSSPSTPNSIEISFFDKLHSQNLICPQYNNHITESWWNQHMFNGPSWKEFVETGVFTFSVSTGFLYGLLKAPGQ